MPMHFSKLNKDCEFQNYERKPKEQAFFSKLEDVFKFVNADVPCSVDVKDTGNK